MMPETSVQPSLDTLLNRYLDRQMGAHASGLVNFDTSEVTPYDAGPVQPIDPQPAWDEALTALVQTPANSANKLSAPPHWPQLVASHEPVVALAWCVGNFPQLVRNFHAILHQANLAALRPSGGRPVDAPALEDWARQIGARQKFPEALLAIGTLRLAKQFDRALELLRTLEPSVPPVWRAAWSNEQAALAWHRGDAEEARQLWRAAEPTLPVRFNRAMTDLFLGDALAAKAELQRVVLEIPEASAWHHLAQLYLAMAR